VSAAGRLRLDRGGLSNLEESLLRAFCSSLEYCGLVPGVRGVGHGCRLLWHGRGSGDQADSAHTSEDGVDVRRCFHLLILPPGEPGCPCL
jgi:hypothetical protein